MIENSDVNFSSGELKSHLSSLTLYDSGLSHMISYYLADGLLRQLSSAQAVYSYFILTAYGINTPKTPLLLKKKKKKSHGCLAETIYNNRPC